MRCNLRTCIAVVLASLCMASAQSGDIQTRLGILDLDILGGDEDLNTMAVNILISHLSEVGAYDVLTQADMSAGFDKIDERLPKNCGEPRCAAAIGSALQLDRMMYGSLDKNEKTFGVRLVLVDVYSRQIIEKVELEGDAGVALNDVLRVAVLKLHGQEEEAADTKTHTYFGPQVDNKRQLLIAAPACVGAGLVWSIANGSLTDRDDNTGSVIYDYSAMESDMDELLGINPGADLIPMFGRPTAMANAYVAASDDAYGVFYNPAGLGWVPNAEAAVGYGYRFGLDNFGASYVNRATREIAFGQGFLHNSDREHLFSEILFLSSISYKLNEWIRFMRPISFGASLKIMNATTGDAQSASAVTGNAFGLGLDLGIQLELSDNIRGGVLFKNVPRLMRWNNTLTDTSYFEPVPPTFYWGGTFIAGYQTFLTCEVQTPLNEDQVWRFAGGVERTVFRVFRLRAGIQKEADFDTPWLFTGGFGLRVEIDKQVKYVALDGSYAYNTLSVFAHPVNLSFIVGF